MMLDKLKELIKQKKSEKETVNKISVKQILQEKNKPALIKESDNIYETTINNVHNIISPSLPKMNTLIFVKSNDDYILVGKNDLNLFNLMKSKVHYSKVYDFGGTIVNAKGDLCVCFVSREENNFGNDCTKWLQDYLTEHNILSSINKNDLLIDNKYKVASWTFRKYNNYFLYGIHVSINLNSDLIKAICTKKTFKIPDCLSKYNINYDDIKKLIITKSKGTYIK